MTTKQLKENEKRISVLDNYDLALFEQNVETSLLDSSSKKELHKMIDARREQLRDAHSLFAEHGDITDLEF